MFTNARMKAMLDTEVAGITHIAYSTNGSAETSIMPRTAISALGGWAAATTANPSVAQNVSAGESAVATGGGTITHFAGFTALTGGTQRTEWIAITDPDPAVVSGGKLTIAAGALKLQIAR